MNVFFCSLFTRKNVTIECCPNTRHFRRLKDPQSTKYFNDEDPATHKGHIKLQLKMHLVHAQNYGAACNAISNQCFTYSSWHCFFQAEEVSYAEQVVKLMDSLVMAGKATVEMNKELNTQKMGAPLLHKTVIFTDMLL